MNGRAELLAERNCGTAALKREFFELQIEIRSKRMLCASTCRLGHVGGGVTFFCS